jgi:Spy/CpxP family protein refolding chaperone
MKKNALYLVLIFSVAINIAVAGTLAFHYWRGNGMVGAGLLCGQKPVGRFMRENLHLDGEEISHLQILFSRNREELLHLRDQVSQERQMLFDLLDHPRVDQSRVDQQIERISALQAKMQKIIINQIINMKSCLPEEKQQKLLDAFRQRPGCGPFGQGPLGPGFGKKRGRW